MAHFSLIAAMDSEHGIGKSGRLPWSLPGDLKHFKSITTQRAHPQKQNMVLMGRKTWDSIPEKFRPLPERINAVLSRKPDLKPPPGVLAFTSFKKALNHFKIHTLDETAPHLFVIGGQQIFETAIQYPECQKLYITHLLQSLQCDTFFPPFEDTFKCTHKSARLNENGITYYFAEYLRRENPAA